MTIFLEDLFQLAADGSIVAVGAPGAIGGATGAPRSNEARVKVFKV